MHKTDRSRKWLPWLLLLAAVVVTAVVYWPGVTGGWVFDDYPNIVDNAAIHIMPGHATLAAWVNAALSSPSSFLHRPLASITFALNWYSGGGNPWPFKVTNIIIHVINGVLVFCMLRALLRLLGLREASATAARDALKPPVIPGLPEGQNPESTKGPQELDSGSPPSGVRNDDKKGRSKGVGPSIDDNAATRLALIVTTAWMLLPINLMAVLYVVQRMESLCQVFVLAGLWAYLHGRWMMLTADGPGRDRRGFALATAGIVLGTLLGLTSKETAVLLPVFAFLAEAVVVRFARPGAVPVPSVHTSFGEDNDSGAWRSRVTDSGFRPAAGPGMTKKESDHSGMTKEQSAGPGMTRENGAAMAGPITNAESSSDAARAIHPLRHSGAARSAEPGIQLSTSPEPTSSTHDKRIWTLFTVTLFIPAVLGFASLLRDALRSAAWAGRDFTLAQRLLTEPRVLVDYLHWTLLPNPLVLSLYHDEIVKSTGLLTPWTTLGSMLLLAALIVIAVWLRKRRPLVALGIGWFFAAQLLTATIVPLELVYEQRMYFASIGVLLAAGTLLLGLRWRIRWPLLRGFLVTAALLWFGAATLLRAQEWSNPRRQAVIEANRHPESPRAVYEAGRLLLIASDYQPGTLLDESEKYLRRAAALPDSSALADQALIMLTDHQHHGDDAAYWTSMTRKLRDQPTRQEDISALISLTNCYGSGICKFDVSNLQQAYAAVLSRPHPIARLDGAYAAFQRDILHDDAVAAEYLARAVAGDPSEPAYRIDLAALYAKQGETGKALQQIDALRRLDYAGRLDKQIEFLERLVEQGKTPSR